jgi:hypothetical protein
MPTKKEPPGMAPTDDEGLQVASSGETSAGVDTKGMSGQRPDPRLRHEPEDDDHHRQRRDQEHDRGRPIEQRTR